MIGFIKKDLLMIKNNVKYSLIIIIALAIISFNENSASGSMLVFVPIFLSTMFCLSLFSYDEYNKWDAYACTLPNGRTNVVKSKYITNIIIILIAFFFTLIISLLLSAIKFGGMTQHIIELLYTTLFASFLIITITYPLIFKFGIEKGRILLSISIFSLSGFIALFSHSLNTNYLEFRTFFKSYYLVIIPIISIILLYISYLISKNIYSKKEF